MFPRNCEAVAQTHTLTHTPPPAHRSNGRLQRVLTPLFLEFIWSTITIVSIVRTINIKPQRPQYYIQFSYSDVSNSFQPHELQQVRLPCLSPTPGVYSNSCPLHWWCHPTISSSAVPFSSCLQSFPASGSFPRNQFFTSGGQSVGVSAFQLHHQSF